MNTNDENLREDLIVHDEDLYNKEDIIKKIQEIETKMGMNRKRAIAYGINARLIPKINNPHVQEEWELTEVDVKEIYGTEEGKTYS